MAKKLDIINIDPQAICDFLATHPRSSATEIWIALDPGSYQREKGHFVALGKDPKMFDSMIGGHLMRPTLGQLEKDGLIQKRFGTGRKVPGYPLVETCDYVLTAKGVSCGG